MSKKIFTIQLPTRAEALAGVRKVAIRPGFGMRDKANDYKRHEKHKKGFDY